MAVLGALVALVPVLALLVLLVVAVRRQFCRPPVITLPRPNGSNGGDPAGDREPRRPLVPSNAGSIEIPEPRSRQAS